MAKVTATVSVRGVDAGQMLAAALAKLAEVSDSKWTITEAYLNDYGAMESEVATRDGMLPMWTGSVTATAEVKEA